MKKLLLTILLTLSVLIVFSSCGENQAVTTQSVTTRAVSSHAPLTTVIITEGSAPTTASPTTQAPTTATPTTQAPATTAPVTTAPVTTAPKIEDMAVFAKDGKSSCEIVYADDANENVTTYAKKLANAVKELFDTDAVLCKESEKAGTFDYTIVIGNTSIDTDGTVKAALPDNSSYLITVKDKNVFVLSKCEEILDLAVTELINLMESSYFASEKIACIENTTNIGVDLDENFVKADWELRVPSYQGGTLLNGSYSQGPAIITGLSQKEHSYMHLVKDTTSDEYKTYIEKAKKMGYEVTYESQTLDNLYTMLEDKYTDRMVYVYYVAKLKEVKIIDERSSVPLSEFEYIYEPKDGDTTIFYQYGLYHDLNCEVTSTTVNNGMSYVIKTADNSVICVDGGDIEQASMDALEGYYNFLKDITGTKDGEKVRIAAWYFTHPHSDHIYFARKFMKYYKDKITIERVISSFSYSWDMRDITPDAVSIKVHTGEKIRISNIVINVLFTLEDGVKQLGNGITQTLTSTNSESVILKFEFDGISALMLGDANSNNEGVMLKMYGASIFKTDIMQLAHHGLNTLSTVYRNAKAKINLLPNYHSGRMDSIRDLVLKSGGEGSQYYISHEGTYGFSAVDGVPTLVDTRERIGGEYDRSGY